MFALASLCLAVGVFLAGKTAFNRVRLAHSYSGMLSAYPRLAIERISFSKYLVQGTLPDNDPHFARLDIWLVAGSADIQYDLSQFRINRRKTDYLTKTLALSYSGTTPFRAMASVAIDPTRVRKIETVKPREYGADELREMKKTAALALGAAGTAIGGTAGFGAGNAAMTAFGPLSSASPATRYSGGIGALIGAAAGGALGAGAAYCFTDTFIASLQGNFSGEASAMDMIAAAKPIMERELLESGESEQARIESFEARLSALAKRAGWASVIVEYGKGR